MKDDSNGKSGQMSVNLNLDNTPILYTDNIIITTNETMGWFWMFVRGLGRVTNYVL